MHLMIYIMFVIQIRRKCYDFYHLLLICHLGIFLILRSHYVVLICSNQMLGPDTNLNPVEFGWNTVDSVLMPNKCIVTLSEMYTASYGCKEKRTANCQCK